MKKTDLRRRRRARYLLGTAILLTLAAAGLAVGVPAPGGAAAARRPVTLHVSADVVATGSPLTLTGRVRSLRPGQRVTVLLQERSAGRWHVLARTRTKARGRYRFTLRPTAEGLLTLRTRVRHTRQHSSVRRVSVGSPRLRWVTARAVPGSLASEFETRDHALSDDGRYVAFRIGIPLTADAPASGVQAIYRWDRVTNAVVLVSRKADGIPLTSGAIEPSISADGRFVTYTSTDPGSSAQPDTNAAADVFVWDAELGTSTLVSRSREGDRSANRGAATATISPNGRFVVFTSVASDLTAGLPGAAAAFGQVYRLDRATQRIELVSVNDGFAADSFSVGATVADNGTVAYVTAANLDGTDHNFAPDVYVATAPGQSRRLTRDAAGGDADSTSSAPSISADGQVVAFLSSASDLVAGDTNGKPDIFVQRLDDPMARLVSRAFDGGPADGAADGNGLDLAASGRFVVYSTVATNAFPGDTNGRPDVLLADLATGQSRIVTHPVGGLPWASEDFFLTRVSSDGRYVSLAAESGTAPGGLGFPGHRQLEIFLWDAQGVA